MSSSARCPRRRIESVRIRQVGARAPTTACFYTATQMSRPLPEAMKKPWVARIPGSGAAMIKQAEKTYAPLEVERQVQEFWDRAKVYRKTVAAREKGEDFFCGAGPPYTTGSIHLGNVLNKTIKDLVVRYHRMRGYHVRDQPGYDMHGLPIEVQVEKTLGITNKKEIEELGIEKFVNTCRTFAEDLLKKMTAQFQSLGIWLDWDRPYMTIRNEFIEAAWWTLKHAHERDWIYEALRSIQWCSRCETALADAEVEYSDETDPSIYVKFRIAGKPNESLLIWTTTPWTLPANLAIAAHPDFRYAKVKIPHGKKPEYIWLMESAVPEVMARGGVTKYSVVETKKGSDLVGLAYLHPLRAKLPYQKGVKGEWVHKVVSSDTVVAEYTGLVHSAPGHGPEDFELGQKLGLPAFSPVDARGHFTPDAGAYAGQIVREANPRIVEDLRAAHVLFAVETILHPYGHCWRCKTPILFRATDQWFLNVTEVKPKMVEEVARVKWFPDWAGSARQLDWTSNLRDWCISRQRFWGIPLPIWRCVKCQHWTVVGSADALRKANGYTEGMDLHRPGIDRVVLRCEKCDGEMRRVPDTVDVWFDSGVSSWASLGYPAREDEFRRWWPQNWIVEGPDQTRGWFSSQLAAGVVAFNSAPYEQVLMHGWVNDPAGRQMHKSLGNVIEPENGINKFGVDPLRFYFIAVNAPWDDITFQEDGVRTAQRTLNILWNVLRFATTYMVLDRFDPFATDLAEAIYQRLDGRKLSVHMLDWPAVREPRLRPELERSMAIVQELVEVVSKERQKGGRKLRWPLKLIAVRTATPEAAKALAALRDIFLDQVNAKDLAILRTTDEFPGTIVVVKPDPAAIGKTYKVLAPKIVKLLAVRPAEEIRRAFERGSYSLQVEGQTLSIDLSMVRLEKGLPPDVARVETPHGEVYLDLRVTPELQAEAYARELIRRIQQMRKDLDLDVDDFIATVIKTDKEFASSLDSQKAFIARETRSRSLTFTDKPVESEHVVEWKDVDGHAVTIGVTPLHLSEPIREFTRISDITVQKAMALFDAGYKSLATLRATTKQELAAVDGLTPGDIDRIFEFLASPEKSEAICRICQASVPSGMRRCPRCGEALTSEAIPCPRCNSAIPPGAETCPVCGFALSVQTTHGTPSRVACVACGELIPVGSSGCPSCGAPQRLRAASVSTGASGDAPPPLLKDSSSYLVREATPEEAYRLFLIAQKAGKKGMVITRLFPQKVRERFGLSDLPILWLSNVGKEDTIRPKDLEKLSLAAEQFLSREKGVVLLDAIEYLVTNNNFLTVLRLVQSIRDQVAVNNGVLLLSVNPSTLDAHQMTLLEREVDRVVDVPTGSGASGSG